MSFCCCLLTENEIAHILFSCLCKKSWPTPRKLQVNKHPHSVKIHLTLLKRNALLPTLPHYNLVSTCVWKWFFMCKMMEHNVTELNSYVWFSEDREHDVAFTLSTFGIVFLWLLQESSVILRSVRVAFIAVPLFREVCVCACTNMWMGSWYCNDTEMLWCVCYFSVANHSRSTALTFSLLWILRQIWVCKSCAVRLWVT